MSHEYCILNLLNIKDKNIKLSKNFYSTLTIDNLTYKVIEGILSYEPEFCPKCGCIFNNHQTYEKNGFKSFRRFKARIMICKNLLHMKKARI